MGKDNCECTGYIIDGPVCKNECIHFELKSSDCPKHEPKSYRTNYGFYLALVIFIGLMIFVGIRKLTKEDTPVTLGVSREYIYISDTTHRMHDDTILILKTGEYRIVNGLLCRKVLK